MTILSPRRPVLGFEGLYEVDANGRVFSISRIGKTPYGIRSYGGVELKGIILRGYQKVELSNRAVRRQVFVHKIVLEAFVGKAPAGMQCRHLNNVKTDNRLENLAWGTPQENANDRIAAGTTKNVVRKVSDEQVREIRRKLMPIKDQAKFYGVSVSLIRKIRCFEVRAILPALEAA